VIFFFILEGAQPFNRQFSLNDLTISHPFATVERVTGVQCIWIALGIPFIVILVVTLVHARKLRYSHQQLYHNLQLAVLGLILSLAISGVVTDILKNWIARPRPDFLDRCGPKVGTPTAILVNIDVCTAPYGTRILIDGMRSTPSGHSSISFSGLLFLTLWMMGQFKIFHTKQPMYKIIIACSPLGLATYIALSRTQDYRHHFVDIILGTLIGCIFASLSYSRYFNEQETEDQSTPILPY
jgi:diacylglycerol diphosphate phosphatase/phosphatidate phosphatase